MLLFLLGAASLMIPSPSLKSAFFEDHPVLTTCGAVGLAMATAAGLIWLFEKKETADDIPRYFADLEQAIITVESHEYVRAWLKDIEWQKWYCNLVASKKNAGEMYKVLRELQQLENALELWKLSRVLNLTKKYGVRIDDALTYKKRIARLTNALSEMEKRTTEMYKQRFEYEALLKKYESFHHRINYFKEHEIFKIDINNIKSYAMMAFPTSAWPYVDVMRFLEVTKHDVHLLLQEIAEAPFYNEKDALLAVVQELHGRLQWAVEYLVHSPDYQQQVQMKHQYDLVRQGGNGTVQYI